MQSGKKTGLWVGKDASEKAIQRDVHERIKRVFQEAFDAYVGAGAYERVTGRMGYRHGTKEREISISAGRYDLNVLRARLFHANGGEEE
ncbi:MAG: transposase [Elusimicrobia bacterium]|nr:transposase [Candidatus Obscuribacterium magneticum]